MERYIGKSSKCSTSHLSIIYSIILSTEKLRPLWKCDELYWTTDVNQMITIINYIDLLKHLFYSHTISKIFFKLFHFTRLKILFVQIIQRSTTLCYLAETDWCNFRGIDHENMLFCEESHWIWPQNHWYHQNAGRFYWQNIYWGWWIDMSAIFFISIGIYCSSLLMLLFLFFKITKYSLCPKLNRQWNNRERDIYSIQMLILSFYFRKKSFAKEKIL